MTGDLDSSIDELFRAPLDQFTAKRNELAAVLKKGGDRENADRVKALAKPGVAAWAVNQAWWQHQSAFREMLDAGAALREAHAAFAKGKAGGVRAEMDARERTVSAVIDKAVAALGGPSKVAHDLRHRIAGTVESLASSGVPPDLTLGRLSADLQSSGFEALSALAGLPSPAASRPVPPPRPVLVHSSVPGQSKAEQKADAKAELAAREREQKLADAEARVTAGEAALEAATDDVKTTEAADAKARAALDKATAHVTDLEQKLETAQDELREARRTASKATHEASEAEMNRARAARDLQRAHDALKELG